MAAREVEWQERLDAAMDARGVTGGELARRTGFTSQYINSLRSKGRGARLPLDTARRLAQALGLSVDWLTSGAGPRERLSDVYPVHQDPADAAPASSTGQIPSFDRDERYPTRGEAVALLATTVEPEVLAALRAAVPDDPEIDPGRDFWIDYAKDLARDLRRIKSDRDLGAAGKAPESRYMKRSKPAK
jgi:transcriptional regulator with XRE-family HTH domain